MKTRKCVVFLLVMVLLVSLLAGCSKKEKKQTGNDAKVEDNKTGNQESGKQDTDSQDEKDNDTNQAEDSKQTEETGSDVLTELTLPLTEEKKEISVWTFYNNSFVEDPNEIEGVKEMEKRTNVHVKWMPVGGQELVEKFGLMLASNNIPDIVYLAGTTSYPGGIEKGIEEGLFTDCTELVEKWMPNYRELRKATPELEKDTMTDAGTLACIYGINSSNDGVYAPKEWYGLAVREDMLPDIGVKELPETIEEWHTMLVAAKEHGIEAPLLTGKNGYISTAAFMTAYDVLPEFYQENGTVKYGPLEDGYREWVQLFHDWYAEGLIDRNFVSTDAAMSADALYSTTGKSLAFSAVSFFTGNGYRLMGYTDDEKVNVTAVKNPVVTKGDMPRTASSNGGTAVRGNEIYLSASSKYPELVAQWLDYQFSVDGMMLNFYGIEGVTYHKTEDGDIAFDDLILHNPDGLMVNEALSLYAIGNGPMRYNQSYNDYLRVGALYYEDQQNTWTAQDTSMGLPPTSMTSEEGIAYNSTYTAIKTLVDEYTVKFIMGTEPMENYDKFVDQIRQFGIEDCIGYQQAALDRYNKRGQ